ALEGSPARAADPFSPWGEGARRAGGSPSARRADEGAFSDAKETPPTPVRPNDLRPHQPATEDVSDVGASDRKSWPHVLSPEGRGESRAVAREGRRCAVRLGLRLVGGLAEKQTRETILAARGEGYADMAAVW